MNRLFYEDEFDALRAVIAHSGKSAKEVACHLFPHMKLESAYARLQACLNEEKDQRLTLSQIVALCKFCGQADALMFLADELGFERPVPMVREDERARLQREFVESVRVQQGIIDRLERLNEAPALKAVGR